MNQWLPVDRAGLNTGQTERLHGVEVKVFLSPYDIPDAISGYYDKSIRRFVIAFKYSNEEPTVVEKQDQLVSLRIGKNSQRIWEICLDVDAAKANAVKLNVVKLAEQAIDRFEKTRSPSCPPERFSIPRKVIEKKRQQLLAGSLH